MSGLAATDVLKSQLKTGDMEMATILIAADEDNGVIEVNSKEEGSEDGHSSPQVLKGYDYAVGTQECNFQEVKFFKMCTQGTQTELLMRYHVAASM